MFRREPVRPRSVSLLPAAILVLLGGIFATFTANAQTPNSWSTGAPMPTPRMSPFTGVIGANIYVIGGENDSANLSVNEIYNTSTNTWSKGAPMPTPRWVGGTAVVNGILYAIGGQGAGGPLSVVEAYNPSTDSWSTKAPMPVTDDSLCGAVVDNGIIYIIGGYRNSSGRLNTVLSYNPVTNAWTTLAPLKVGKSTSAVGLVGSMIVAAGGLTNSGVTTDNEGYNVATNSWTTLAPLPTARHAGCFEAVGSTLYFAGGHNVGNGAPIFNTMDAYDADTNSWTSGLPTMLYGVVNPGSASVNGTMYCFGGSNEGDPEQGTIYNYTQIYQPAAVSTAAPTNVLPQLAFGGGWSTSLYFTNLTASSVSFPVNFVAGDGTPLSIPALGGSDTQMSLSARGTATIDVSSSGDLVEGYVTAALPSGVTGYGVFRYQASPSTLGQEAVVPLSGTTATTSSMIFDETNFTTGVAVVGLGSAAVTVNVTAYNMQGGVLGTGSIQLAGNGKTAVLLRDIPGLSSVIGQLGSVDFSVSSGAVAALGIRYNGQAFTSIPTSDR